MWNFKQALMSNLKYRLHQTSSRANWGRFGSIRMSCPGAPDNKDNMAKSWLKFPRPRNPTAEYKPMLTHQSLVWTMVGEKQGVDIPVGKQAVQLHQLRRDPR